ncbi:hypothetical protein Micbo1qcDRAFT_154726 [Microdochium bolleyi]|uniref:Xylanolytic transcriptional activator regulatory domain-containing protein n=1 Tax=Microdochium bolleyi TaxID=196109 RepID=A0A136II95_9PEZI|nr:hypothetical protein Micbo1qcDRAFT_154726 [Microdochium bolleyi]
MGEAYERLKVLISLGFEPDRLHVLKALCLISCYSATPSSQHGSGLGGQSHWMDLAVRQMLQMGLHRRAMYADGVARNQAEAGRLLRIFWFLHVTCIRRPYSLLEDYDVPLPSLDDFDIKSTADRLQAQVFIEMTKLHIIIAHVTAHQRQHKNSQHQQTQHRRLTAEQQVDTIITELCAWIRGLPSELHLFRSSSDTTPQQPQRRADYSRPVSEMMILYFVAITYVEKIRPSHCSRSRVRTTEPHSFTLIALLASSCAVALYDEMLCRDEAKFLPWQTGYCCLAVAVPLIYGSQVQLSETGDSLKAQKQQRSRELDTVRSVIQDIKPTYTHADMVVQMITKLQTSVDTGQNGDVGATREAEALNLGAPRALVREMFPFPTDMCANMRLLNAAEVETLSPLLPSIAPDSVVGDEGYDAGNQWEIPLDDGLWDFSLTDLYGVDFGSMFGSYGDVFIS